MKKYLKAIIGLYIISAVIFSIFMINRFFYNAVVNQSPFWVNNRESTMGLFFKKWDDINQAYDLGGAGDKTPRWYSIATDPTFKALPMDWQKAKAEEYIRKYIENASGIDGKKVKRWLLEIINFVKHGIMTHEDVFISSDSLHMQTYSSHLSQILTFIPLISYYYAIQEDLPIALSLFPIVMGIPLLICQIVLWVINLARKKRLPFLFCLTKRSLSIIIKLSLLTGIIFLVIGIKNEYKTATTTNFVSGKWFYLQMGVLRGVLALIIAFLGFWSMKAVFCLVNNEIRKIVNLLKGIKMIKGGK